MYDKKSVNCWDKKGVVPGTLAGVATHLFF